MQYEYADHIQYGQLQGLHALRSLASIMYYFRKYANSDYYLCLLIRC
jgi:hypothetical protein